eukprot:gene15380-biopygen12805
MKVILAFFIAIGVAVCHAELFEGDIKLDPNTLEIVEGQNTFDAVKSDTQKWTNGKVPYIFDSNFGGEQDISIGQGCEYKGIVMHEMMHASGFWHEQSRLDRDNYIRVFWDNVSGGRNNYNFRKYSHGQADYYGEGYDYDSIMHYGNWYFSENGKMTIQAVNDPYKIVGQRDGFSQTDVRQLNKVALTKQVVVPEMPRGVNAIETQDTCLITVAKAAKNFERVELAPAARMIINRVQLGPSHHEIIV